MLGKAMMDGAPPGPAPEQQPAPGGDEPTDGREPASPEEQAAYEGYVNAAMEVIMGDGGEPDPMVLANLKGEYDQATAQRFAKADPPLRPLDKAPIDPLAAATVAVLLQIEDIAAQSGAELQDEIVYNGGAEIMSVLTEISETAGIHTYSDDDLEVAWYRGCDLYRISSQRVDPEQLKQEFGAFIEADKAGAFEGGKAAA